MPPVIVDMPWPTANEEVRLPDGSPLVCPTAGRPLRLLHDQIAVWASLTPADWQAPAAGLHVFPLIIDTGFNEYLLLQGAQAGAWLPAQVRLALRRNGRFFPVRDERIENWAALLWIYPNVPGTRALDLGASPVRLELPDGATLAPVGSRYCREKPLLGMRTITSNRLTLRIDGARQRIWLDTPELPDSLDSAQL